MHPQIEVIVAAVENARTNNLPQLVTAIFKHYILDESYVHKDVRQSILSEVNTKLGTRLSITQIKKANLSLLAQYPGDLPAKPKLVEVEELHGNSELPAANIQAQNNQAATQQTLEQENMTNANTTAAVETATTFDISVLNELKTAEDYVAAAAMTKPVRDLLIQTLSVRPETKSAKKRFAFFSTWLHDVAGKKAVKAYVKFAETVEGHIDNTDDRISCFLCLTKVGAERSAEFGAHVVGGASPTQAAEAVEAKSKKEATAAKEAGRSGYSFTRANDDGIRSGWVAVAGAVVGGGLDMMKSGFSIGSVAGTAVAGVGAYFAGEMLDDYVDNEYIRYAAAGALGAALGIIGSRIGGSLLPSDLFTGDSAPELVSDKPTVVVNVPAAQPAISHVPAAAGFFPGL